MLSLLTSLAERILLQAQPLEPTVGLAAGLVGSQILAALIVGLLTAFGVQLLLTNLGIALGITTLRGVLRPRQAAVPDRVSAAEEAAPTSSSRLSLGTMAGLGILLMINTVLFVACFLATRFSQIREPFSGAVIGLVIWSAYSVLLVWISSAVVTSLAGLVLGTTVRGIRQLFQVLLSLVRGSAADETLEAATLAAVREDVQAALRAIEAQALTASLQPTLFTHPSDSSLPDPNPSTVAPADQAASTPWSVQAPWQTTLHAILQGLPPQHRREVAERLAAQPDVIKEQLREALPETEVERVFEQLSREFGPDASGPPAPERSESDLVQWLRSILPPAVAPADEPGSGASFPQRLWELLRQRDLKLDLKLLLRTIWQRVDLSDWEVTQLWQQVQQVWSSHEGNRPAWGEPNLVCMDLADYLLHLDTWEFLAPDFEAQVRSVLFDPDAAPEEVQRQLQPLQESDIRSILQQHGDLTAAQEQTIAARIEAVRRQVLATIDAAVVQDAEQELRQLLQDRCPTADSWLPELVLEVLNSWLPQADATRLFLCEPEALAAWLHRETPLMPEQIAEVCQSVQPLYQRHWRRIHDPSAYEQQIIAELQQSLVSYLRHTRTKRLTPKQIERKLQMLLEPAQAKLSLIGATLPPFDRSAMADVLRRRKSLDKKQRHAILDQIEHLWSQQQTIAAANSTQTVKPLTEVLINYLNSPDLTHLNPDEWAQKLQQFLRASGFDLPRLRHGLRQLDWQQLQSQLPEESQSQLRAALPMLQQWVWQVLRTPRRYSRRHAVTRAEAQRRFALYLQYAPRAELASDHLRARLQQLRLQLKMAAESDPASEAVEITDPATLTQGLSQRSDFSPAEVEALATEITAAWQELAAEPPAASEESVLEQFMTQLKRVVQPAPADLDPDEIPPLSVAIEPLVEPLVEQLVAQSQASLSQIHQSLQAALDHASGHGLVSLEQLQDRLQQFNREMLLPLLPASSLVSVPQGVLAQVESWRDQALQQVEQLQQALQQRMEDVKSQTQQRFEETRKAAAAAAWWLFGILGSAAVTSALAGMLATQ